jgi:hypothetical protein
MENDAMKTILFAFLFIASVSAHAQLSFEARVDSVKEFFLTSPEAAGQPDYCVATVKLLSPAHRSEGVEIFKSLVRGASTAVIDRFRMMEAFMYTRVVLPDSVQKLVRSVWTFVPVNPLRLEHDKVMFYTSLLLSAEQFGNDQSWFNHRSTLENIADAKDFLTRWMKEVTEQGQQEFDSPTVGPMFIASMLLLREYCLDSFLRTRADLMTQWLLADFAHEYIGGYYAGAHSYEDQYSTMQPVGAEISGLGWLYFGDGPMLYTREQLFAALSSFRPHPAIVEMATQRLKPYLAREMKRSADRVRGDSVRSRPVAKYTYMTPLYAVGSIRGGFVFPFKQHTWDVTWPADSGAVTSLYFMQPYAEQSGVAEFFPHSHSLVSRYVSRDDPYYNDMAKAVGGSPYEDVFQHKNTIIALYDIPKIDRFPIISGFLPPGTYGFDVDSLGSGWVTFNQGEVYLAVYPLKKYTIFSAELGKRIFSMYRKNGVIMQVVGMHEVASYEEFVKKIRASKINVKEFESKGKIRYTTIYGDKLEFTYHGDGRVNGKNIQADTSKLFDSPWIECKRGTGVMTIRSEKGKCIIDMQNRTIR